MVGRRATALALTVTATAVAVAVALAPLPSGGRPRATRVIGGCRATLQPVRVDPAPPSRAQLKPRVWADLHSGDGLRAVVIGELRRADESHARVSEVLIRPARGAGGCRGRALTGSVMAARRVVVAAVES